MKAVLIACDSQFIHSNLAVRYLKKHGEEKGYDIKIIESTVNDLSGKLLEEIDENEPDIAVFSCYIWNIEYMKKVISDLRKIRPEVMIWVGGPEAQYDWEAFLNETEADLIMTSEGEETFPHLLDEVRKARDAGRIPDFKGVRNIAYKSGSEIIKTEETEPLDFDTVLFPYDENSVAELKNRIVYYESQRGCPFRCSYCLSSIDKRVRKRNTEKVFKELYFFIKSGVKLVKFVDRTFNADEVHSYRIWEYLIERYTEAEREGRKFNTRFHFEIEAGILSKRQTELLINAPKGLFQVEAGIQSTDESVLKLINRVSDTEKIGENLKRIIESGNVHVHTDLIVGLPGDDFDTFINSFNICMNMHPDMLQIGFLKVLKGTPISHETARFGIKYRDYPPYEVLSSDGFSYKKIRYIKKIEDLVDKYWNSGSFHNSIRYLLSFDKTPFELFSEIERIHSEGNSINKNLSNDDCYSLLIKYGETLEPEKTEILKEFLRFDYLTRNRKGYLPDTLKSEKYNRLKSEVITDPKTGEKLKGTISWYTIDTLRYFKEGSLERVETAVFTSLNTKKIFKVRYEINNFTVEEEVDIR